MTKISNRDQSSHGADIEDFDTLRAYLTTRRCVKVGETVSFRNLRGGVSNRTVKVAWATAMARF